MNPKYFKPITSDKMPKPRTRLPQYDMCLEEFLASNSNYGEVNLEALPSKNERIVLSSLKWRINNNPSFKGIRAIMHDKKIFLEKVKE
jgi:hypothetical protein